MPFSQIIPPSPSPSESKSLLYTAVSFFLSCIQGRHCHLSKFHIYVLVYCIGALMLLANYLLTVFPRVSSVATCACPGPVCSERHFSPFQCSVPHHREAYSCRLHFQLYCWEYWRLDGKERC